jgi:hypothetical protein
LKYFLLSVNYFNILSLHSLSLLGYYLSFPPILTYNKLILFVLSSSRVNIKRKENKILTRKKTMSFSFGFSGDDIDHDVDVSQTQTQSPAITTQAQPPASYSAFPVAGKPQLPATLHSLSDFLSQLHSILE